MIGDNDKDTQEKHSNTVMASYQTSRFHCDALFEADTKRSDHN